MRVVLANRFLTMSSDDISRTVLPIPGFSRLSWTALSTLGWAIGWVAGWAVFSAIPSSALPSALRWSIWPIPAAVAGLTVGVLQGLVFRHYSRRAVVWIGATALGMVIGSGIAFSAVSLFMQSKLADALFEVFGLLDWLVAGLFGGALGGLIPASLQWATLRLTGKTPGLVLLSLGVGWALGLGIIAASWFIVVILVVGAEMEIGTFALGAIPGAASGLLFGIISAYGIGRWSWRRGV